MQCTPHFGNKENVRDQLSERLYVICSQHDITVSQDTVKDTTVYFNSEVLSEMEERLEHSELVNNLNASDLSEAYPDMLTFCASLSR